jgi:hypothetical protein
MHKTNANGYGGTDFTRIGRKIGAEGYGNRANCRFRAIMR